MQALLLTIHILGAALWIGAGVYSSFAYRRHAANRTLRVIFAVDERMGGMFFGTAVAVVLLSGIGLVLNSDAYAFGHAFVIIGIAVVVLIGAVEGLLLGPSTKRTVEAEAEGGSEMDPVFRWGTLFYIPVFAFTVWAMVTKLGM